MVKNALIALLLLSATAKANVILSITNLDSIIISLSAQLPDNFWKCAGGQPSTIIHRADAYYVDGGLYTSDIGFDYCVPITPTTLPQTPWSFELLTANPAEWRINEEGTYDPDWFVVGTVIDGFNTITALDSSQEQTVFGINNVPTLANVPYYITNFAWSVTKMTNVPEPAYLLSMGLVLLSRRMNHV